MDLPEPVGPTRATVRPAGTVEGDVVQDAGGPADSSPERDRRSEADAAQASAAGPVAPAGPRAVGHVAGGGEHLLDPLPADDAARQLGEHPADRPDREGEHGEQERDADHLGDGRSRPGAAGPRPTHQHGERAEAGQRLQQRVEQAAQPADR